MLKVISTFLIAIQIIALSSILLFCSPESSILKWPGGKIPYTFFGDFTDEDKKEIQEAMKEWEKAADITFIHIEGNTYGENFYEIRKVKTKEEVISNCNGTKEKVIMCSASSTVGLTSDNHMTIENCTTPKLILHELGHCIGLRHEHRRPDRDKYVTILKENITKSNYYNFKFLLPEDFLYPYKRFKYDYNSIMHYSDTLFTKNCKKTIISKEPIGGRVLSKLDKDKAEYIYGASK